MPFCNHRDTLRRRGGPLEIPLIPFLGLLSPRRRYCAENNAMGQQSAELSVRAPRKRQGLEVRRIDEETVILDTQSERMHNLNSTAAFIFNSVDGSRTLEQIWKDLADGFEISLEVAEQDTRNLVAQLRELKLLE